MYDFKECLESIKILGVFDICVLQVPNERPKPGEKVTGGLNLTLKNDLGFIGEFNSRQKITFAITVKAKRRDDLHVVWAEGADREIRSLSDQTPTSATALFTKRIPTDQTMSGEYVTKNTPKLGNGIWIISTTGGQLQMWEVAIVTILKKGKSRGYLSLQKVYTAEMFRCTLEEGPDQWDDPVYVDEAKFPNYADWVSLRLFLSKVVNTSNLRSLSECQSVEFEQPSVSLIDRQAEVIWFNQSKGFGFARVAGEDPNPNFHRSEVKDQEFPAFEPGQFIRYSSLNRTPRGVQLVGVTE